MPTTRYERFKWRQKKFSKRRKRATRHNSTAGSPQTLGHHGGGKRWLLIDGGLQKSHGVNYTSAHGTRVESTLLVPVFPVFSGGGYRTWPHVKFTGLFYLIKRAAGKHQDFPLLGYQVHRVHRWGHKTNRMNGRQRKIVGATWYAYRFGYFPNWDPLTRYPNILDLLTDPSADQEGIWPFHVPIAY